MNYPVIDCHCHIYPEKIAARAVAAISRFYSLPMRCDGTAQDLIRQGSEAGVKRYVVFSVATRPAQTRSINEFIAKTVSEHPGIMTGLGTIHPDSKDMKGDIDHLESLGLHGVKMHPDMQKFRIDDPRSMKICELCEGRMPVMFHTGDPRYSYSNPEQLIPVLDRFPGLTVIAAHFGGWYIFGEAAEKLHGRPNLYVDCSSSFYTLTPEESLNIIRLYGADRVMFGTDYPMWQASKELAYLYHLDLSEEERKNILYRNAEKVLGIKPYTES